MPTAGAAPPWRSATCSPSPRRATGSCRSSPPSAPSRSSSSPRTASWCRILDLPPPTPSCPSSARLSGRVSLPRAGKPPRERPPPGWWGRGGWDWCRWRVTLQRLLFAGNVAQSVACLRVRNWCVSACGRAFARALSIVVGGDEWLLEHLY